MTDCPNCEYHKNRAARWRAEAYAQAGHDVIERPWVGLTDEERDAITSKVIGFNSCVGWEEDYAKAIEAKLKDKNVQL